MNRRKCPAGLSEIFTRTHRFPNGRHQRPVTALSVRWLRCARKTAQSPPAAEVSDRACCGLRTAAGNMPSRMDPSRGTFIVLDGTEGSGKSTQARLLHERLTRELGPDAVLLVRDPGTTRIGEQVRSLLLNPDHAEMNMRCEMLLYMAARAQMMAE